MHIYAFGSVVRGEVDTSSDIDMLALVEGQSDRFNPAEYSVYSYARILELWEQGNPFAWHLFIESKLVYSQDGVDYLRHIGKPKQYINGLSDCKKFHEIFLSAKNSLEGSHLTEIFDLSSVFLAIRNLATCYALQLGSKPDFSRNSALCLGSRSLRIEKSVYDVLERARVLSTRGVGSFLTQQEIHEAKMSLEKINSWMVEVIDGIE